MATRLLSADPSGYPPITPVKRMRSTPISTKAPNHIVCVHKRRQSAMPKGKRSESHDDSTSTSKKVEFLVEWLHRPPGQQKLTWEDESLVRDIAAAELEVFDVRDQNAVNASARESTGKRLRVVSQTLKDSGELYVVDREGESRGDGHNGVETLADNDEDEDLMPASSSSSDSGDDDSFTVSPQSAGSPSSDDAATDDLDPEPATPRSDAPQDPHTPDT